MVNVSPSLFLELLQRIARVTKDYLGVLNEDSLRKNFILVYELLDEVIVSTLHQLSSCHSELLSFVTWLLGHYQSLMWSLTKKLWLPEWLVWFICLRECLLSSSVGMYMVLLTSWIVRSGLWIPTNNLYWGSEVIHIQWTHYGWCRKAATTWSCCYVHGNASAHYCKKHNIRVHSFI